jgi:hypothetical protein
LEIAGRYERNLLEQSAKESGSEEHHSVRISLVLEAQTEEQQKERIATLFD